MNVLPMVYNLQRFVPMTSNSCNLCVHEEETIDHLFLRCQYTHCLCLKWKGGIFLQQQVQNVDVFTFFKLILAPPDALIKKERNKSRNSQLQL